MFLLISRSNVPCYTSSSLVMVLWMAAEFPSLQMLPNVWGYTGCLCVSTECKEFHWCRVRAADRCQVLLPAALGGWVRHLLLPLLTSPSLSGRLSPFHPQVCIVRTDSVIHLSSFQFPSPDVFSFPLGTVFRCFSPVATMCISQALQLYWKLLIFWHCYCDFILFFVIGNSQ